MMLKSYKDLIRSLAKSVAATKNVEFIFCRI